MDVRPISPRTVAAARRLVGPARVLDGAAQVLWVVAAIAAGLTALALAVAVWQSEATALGVVVAVVLALLLFVPAFWLHHARGTFADLVDLPRRLEELGQGRPRFTIESREDLSALRSGGAINAARTIRTMVAEVTDFFSPASTVAEVATPTFWVWTGAATVATGVLSLLALGSVVYLVFG